MANLVFGLNQSLDVKPLPVSVPAVSSRRQNIPDRLENVGRLDDKPDIKGDPGNHVPVCAPMRCELAYHI